MKPLAAVLVSYNSRGVLGPCLTSLFCEGLTETDVVVVDNASTDGTPDWLRQEFPRVRVIDQGYNAGYGVAANRGIEAAAAEAVLLANPDTIFQPHSVGRLLKALADHPAGFITPKLLLPDGRINACGNLMHLSGITSCQGYGEPADRYRGTFPVFLLSGAVVLARRETWARSGGFDPEIFLYMEDAELSLRARMLGIESYCAADAAVIHDYRLNLSADKFQWLERHRLWTIYKLYTLPSLLALLPSLLLVSGMTWMFALMKGPRYVAARFKADWWLWSHLHRLWNGRRQFQRVKTQPDQSMLTSLQPNLPLAQLMSGSKLSQSLSRAVTAAFAVLRPRARTSGG